MRVGFPATSGSALDVRTVSIRELEHQLLIFVYYSMIWLMPGFWARRMIILLFDQIQLQMRFCRFDYDQKHI
jgi:hypothetical protein